MDYPTLSMLPDGDSLQTEWDNPAIDPSNSDTDGGYQITRPLYTRDPPRTWTFKYSDLGQADHDALETFWNTVKGSSVAFNWRHPVSAELVNVRFSKDFKLQLLRVGIGTNHRYQSNTISITEV